MLYMFQFKYVLFWSGVCEEQFQLVLRPGNGPQHHWSHGQAQGPPPLFQQSDGYVPRAHPGLT